MSESPLKTLSLCLTDDKDFYLHSKCSYLRPVSQAISSLFSSTTRPAMFWATSIIALSLWCAKVPEATSVSSSLTIRALF